MNDLEAWFDIQLGISTRYWLYAQVIDHRQIMKQLWLPPNSGLGKLAFELTYPYMRQKVRKVYTVTPEGAARSLQKIRRIFDQVGDWLAPGQDYLVGDRFTAADLTFAALAAPVLFPPEYGFKLPPLDQLPKEITSIIQSLRETSAGAYGLRLYKDHRCGSKERIHLSQHPLSLGRQLINRV